MTVMKPQRPSDKSGATSARVALMIAGRDWSALPEGKDSVSRTGAQDICDLEPADQKIARRLEQLGYTVECECGESPDTERAYDKALVFISSTLKLGEKHLQSFCDELNEIPTPVIVSAGELFAPMRMIKKNGGHHTVETDRLRIFEEGARSHPMTARLYGTVAISSKPVSVICGTPNDMAIKIAVPALAAQDQFAIFAYESGRYMCGINAPARRIGFFLDKDTANELTSMGWVLFDVAVAWATAEKAKGFDRIYRHEWREIRRRRAKQRYLEMEQESSDKRSARLKPEQLTKLNSPPEAPPPNLTGLALSGGGIRSATFNLGLLQGLNERGWLRMFDYLSTVSGGGFIGAWWSAWLSRSNAEVPDELLSSRAAPDCAQELKQELEWKLRFDPDKVRSARGFLRRILPMGPDMPETRHKLSIKLWELLTDGYVSSPYVQLQPLLERLLSHECKEGQLRKLLSDAANKRRLEEFFSGKLTPAQLDETIKAGPDKMVEAFLRVAFDKLNDRLFGNTEKGLVAERLYSWEMFQLEGIELSTQTYRLSQECPDDYRRLQLNRLLLEEAYPYELGLGVFPVREQIEPQRAALQEAEMSSGRRVNEEVAADLLSAGRDPVHHLRLFANYLTPRRGALSHDTWRAISIFSRNLTLTWIVLLPLLVVVVLLGQIFFILSSPANDNFFSRYYSLTELAWLAAHPLGLLMNCALALVIPWLLMPESDPWELDEKRWWRFKNPKWWAGVLRNLTALLFVMVIAGPLFRYCCWPLTKYAYWFLIPAGFTILLVLYGYLYSLYLPGQKQWELYVRRNQITMAHSTLLVVWALATLVLGVAGFGPTLIHDLISTPYLKQGGLVVIVAVLSAAIFTAVKGSPSSVSDDKRKKRPAAKNRLLFAVTPPMVLLVLAILFSWLTRKLIGSIANASGTSISKGLILGACLGIAFSFFLVLTEIKWKGRLPLRLLLVLWILFAIWEIGTLADFADCFEKVGITPGNLTSLLCQGTSNRRHWQWSVMNSSGNALNYWILAVAWLAGLPIGGRFAVLDSTRWKKRFAKTAGSHAGNQPPQPLRAIQAERLVINWGKLVRIWIGWLLVGVVAVVWFKLGSWKLNSLPLSYFSERIFIAWGVLMCGVIAVFEVRFSRGSNERARYLLAGIYLLLLIFLALSLFQPPENNEIWRAAWRGAFGLLSVLLGWVVVLGWTADPNQLSMHLFYRARLIRAYLGASNFRRSESRRAITQSVIGDDVRIKDLENCYRGGPYHIINTTLNLVGGSDLATTQRSAAVFTMTKNYCGSSRTGYRDTREYMNGQLTLGTAVAISGAAASPAMGSRTPSAAQAMLMTLLNVRLGFWAPTPNKDYWQESQARLWPFLMLREFMSQTNDLASHCYLTDGAHFENTGLYSLVERGCRYMVVSDCGADPHQQFHDLGEAIRRCRIDFDAEIDIKINPLLPRNGGEAPSHFAIGTIKYSRRHFESLHYTDLSEEARKGIIILFKPVLTGHEDADLIQYGREDAHGFPHQTTADQWYDEAQFESYRRLGQITAHALLEKLEGKEMEDINNRLKSGRKISSDEVKRLFDIAKSIADSESLFQKKEVLSVSDEEEEIEIAD